MNQECDARIQPLVDGKYIAYYSLFDGKTIKAVEGDMLIMNGVWMLIEEWAIFPDKREAPQIWVELPPDCRYQKVQSGGKEIISISHPAFLDTRTRQKREKGWIFPSSPSEPMS